MTQPLVCIVGNSMAHVHRLGEIIFGMLLSKNITKYIKQTDYNKTP